jgi:uncharacterized membrane protein
VLVFQAYIYLYDNAEISLEEIREGIKMNGNEKTTDKRNIATILAVLGIIFVIIGAGIAIIHNPLRGSGIGTLSIVVGIVLLVIGIYMLATKRA